MAALLLRCSFLAALLSALLQRWFCFSGFRLPFSASGFSFLASVLFCSLSRLRLPFSLLLWPRCSHASDVATPVAFFGLAVRLPFSPLLLWPRCRDSGCLFWPRCPRGSLPLLQPCKRPLHLRTQGRRGRGPLHLWPLVPPPIAVVAQLARTIVH